MPDGVNEIAVEAIAFPTGMGLSANDQMARIVKKLVTKASDRKLKDMLAAPQEGIAKHTAILKELIASHGEKVSKEHCKGMEGLVAEAVSTPQKKPPERADAGCRDH